MTYLRTQIKLLTQDIEKLNVLIDTQRETQRDTNNDNTEMSEREELEKWSKERLELIDERKKYKELLKQWVEERRRPNRHCMKIDEQWTMNESLVKEECKEEYKKSEKEIENEQNMKDFNEMGAYYDKHVRQVNPNNKTKKPLNSKTLKNVFSINTHN